MTQRLLTALQDVALEIGARAGRRVSQILRDRTATTLVAWLKQHPEIKVATRDWSTEDARSFSESAP